MVQKEINGKKENRNSCGIIIRAITNERIKNE